MYNAKGRTESKQVLGEHLTLVKKLAYQLKAKLPPNVEADDLIQAGTIGLLDAMSRYEEMEQALFETYAVQRIRGAMLDELRNNDWLPRSTRQNMKKIERAIASLQQQLARSPRESEIAEKLKLPLSDYQQMLGDSAGHQLIYFEDFHDSGDDGGDHFLDRFYSDVSQDPLSGLLDRGLRSAVIGAIESLPDREKMLMGLYYEQELNLKEIGAVLGVTESRVSQLHRRLRSKVIPTTAPSRPRLIPRTGNCRRHGPAVSFACSPHRASMTNACRRSAMRRTARWHRTTRQPVGCEIVGLKSRFCRLTRADKPHPHELATRCQFRRPSVCSCDRTQRTGLCRGRLGRPVAGSAVRAGGVGFPSGRSGPGACPQVRRQGLDWYLDWRTAG